MKTQIDIVVPDGSMQDVVCDLFAKAGLPIVLKGKRTKEGSVDVPWIKRVVFQRPQEIPLYIRNGHFDVGIVGEDWMAEWRCVFPVLLRLPIGRSGNKPVSIVLAVDGATGVTGLAELPSGCEVSTEYVRLVQGYLAANNRTDITVVQSFGNTEHKVRYGATAIVDVSESGESLRENNLRIIATIMKSETVLVAEPEAFRDGEKQKYMLALSCLINGAYQARLHVMITANVPENSVDQAAAIMGGLKGPSCAPIRGSGWFALQSVIKREREQDIILQLLQLGVIDIIVNRDLPLIMS